MEPSLGETFPDKSDQDQPIEQILPAELVMPPEIQRPRPRTGMALVLSILAVGLFVGISWISQQEEQGTQDPELTRRVVAAEVQTIGQVYYALHYLLSNQGAGADETSDLLGDDLPTDSGPVSVRVATIVLYMAIDETRAAESLKELIELAEQYRDAVTDQDRRLIALAQRLVEQGKGAVELTTTEREFLRSELGWFGDLYASMARDASPALEQRVLRRAIRTAAVLGGGAIIVLTLAIVGCVAWPVCLYRWATRPERLHLQLEPIPAGFYLEAFATTMLLALGLQLLLPPLAGMVGVLAAQILATLGLAVLRRTREPARRWLRDLGLHRGRGLLREAFAGVTLYTMVLPVLFVGAVFTGWLSSWVEGAAEEPRTPLDAPETPMHPIIREMVETEPYTVIAVFLAAVVLAPLTEELVFRGALYRFVRGATARWPRGFSALLSALVCGLVFGIVHPQWLSYLPLALVGAVFCVGREWRGSLIASMVAHAIHNGLIVSLTFLLLVG